MRAFLRLPCALAFASLVLVLACGGAVTPAGSSGDAGGDGGLCADGGSPIFDCMGTFATCCPAGAHCDPPSNLQCQVDAAGGADAACRQDSDCHKTSPDECTACQGSTALVCHVGVCLCACQVTD